MDGTLTPPEVIDRLRETFPELTAVSASGVVELLLNSGYVEDAAAAPPDEFSTAEQERYSRNIAFFRRVDLTPRAHNWEAQVRLKHSRVLVLGLGGTGSHVAWALAACGVGRIHCVDRDVVELSNLTRQVLYRESDIGRAKAEITVARLAEVNSSLAITGERRTVECQDDLAELVRGFDALALCADEPGGRGGIRVWANRACRAAKVPWAVGGYSGPLVSVGVFDPGSPCYECLSAGIELTLPPGVPVDLGGPGVIAPSAGVSGHLTAQAIISLVTGIPAVPGGYVTGVNLVAPDQHVYARHPAVPDCPVCGDLRPGAGSTAP
ncbi:HesA/MoeB/ThiF family protein [Sphaerisporangium corydalis]|uniref:HesA/MoeB/ThiF family protein n=1 Tax=Sphaerisporangium corydalis TaxID=1441875 RepID=A0ABV9E7P8_9ACTN|nr:ThiF family adenylyltransferase [Sphaerisporangium corydalis]